MSVTGRILLPIRIECQCYSLDTHAMSSKSFILSGPLSSFHFLLSPTSSLPQPWLWISLSSLPALSRPLHGSCTLVRQNNHIRSPLVPQEPLSLEMLVKSPRIIRRSLSLSGARNTVCGEHTPCISEPPAPLGKIRQVLIHF